jgi:hypothetical protein
MMYYILCLYWEYKLRNRHRSLFSILLSLTSTYFVSAMFPVPCYFPFFFFFLLIISMLHYNHVQYYMLVFHLHFCYHYNCAYVCRNSVHNFSKSIAFVNWMKCFIYLFTSSLFPNDQMSRFAMLLMKFSLSVAFDTRISGVPLFDVRLHMGTLENLLY